MKFALTTVAVSNGVRGECVKFGVLLVAISCFSSALADECASKGLVVVDGPETTEIFFDGLPDLLLRTEGLCGIENGCFFAAILSQGGKEYFILGGQGEKFFVDGICSATMRKVGTERNPGYEVDAGMTSLFQEITSSVWTIEGRNSWIQVTSREYHNQGYELLLGLMDGSDEEHFPKVATEILLGPRDFSIMVSGSPLKQ